MFEKRHYQAIAEVLSTRQWLVQDRGQVEEIVEDFCRMFSHDNPNFNRKEFLKACGVEEE